MCTECQFKGNNRELYYRERFLSSLLRFDNLTEKVSLNKLPELDQMFDLVTRSRFRRTKLDKDADLDIRRKISFAIEASKPIEFSIPFGAYKHWQVPSYPYPDWAEVFNLKHLMDFVTPIALNYGPGVVLNYTYTSGVMDKVSNLPIDAQNTYVESLSKILAYYQQIAPPGVHLRLVDIRDSYAAGELETELERNFEENMACWAQKYSDEVRYKKEQSARNNLVLSGIDDLTNLSEEELETRFQLSAMWCDALDSLSLRRGFNKYGHCIQLVFIRGPSLSLHIGSCRGSNAHFWVGSGVLEERKGLLLETIITAKNLKEMLFNGEIVKIHLENNPPVSLDSLRSIYVKKTGHFREPSGT